MKRLREAVNEYECGVPPSMLSSGLLDMTEPWRRSPRVIETWGQRVNESKSSRIRDPESQRVRESRSQRVRESESQRDTTIFPDLFRIPHPRVRGAVKQFCSSTMKLTTLYNARTMRTPRSDAI